MAPHHPQGHGVPMLCPTHKGILVQSDCMGGDVPGVGLRHAWDSSRTGGRQMEREWMVRVYTGEEWGGKKSKEG